MRYWIYSLLFVFLLSGCNREVTSFDVSDQSGSTKASKEDIGTHGTAPRPREGYDEAPTLRTSTATSTESAGNH